MFISHNTRQQTHRQAVQGDKMTATPAVSSSAQEETSNPITKSEPITPPDASASPEKPTPTPKSLKFWSVFFALCLLGLSTALEATIVTTALPTILQSIPSVGGQYPWVGNAFLLSSAAIQPFIGQLAGLFGRRYPLIFLTVAFILGSGIAGGATGPGALIAGRTVQGLGAGGILVLIDVVVCDLVPALHERAKFLGLVRITGAIGSSVGPIVGGAIANKDWRWCFWLNLITGGVALVYLVLFLRVEGDDEKQKDWRAGLKKIDYVGTLIFMGSVTAVLLGLLMGGVLFPWDSANIIVPIVIGFVGWAAFHLYESFGRVPSPVVPSALFSTRTSAAGFGLAFDGALLLYWVIWFLPVYFQGVLGASPLQSGVNQLPLNLFLVPSGVVAGGVMGKTGGKYKVQHFLGFALISLGVGLFTLLGRDSHKAMWAISQIITAVGLGIILVTVLPAIQVALGQRVDVAKSTAMYAFVRSFGGIWGVTIPSVIFNGQVDALLGSVSDVEVRGQLVDGQAYGFASRGAVQRLPDGVREEVLGVYTDALKTVWQVGLGFALAGFLCVFVVKQYDMMRKPEVKPVLEGEGTDEMSNAERGGAER